MNPVETIWQYLPKKWRSDHLFESDEDILDHSCTTWNRLIEWP